MISIIVPVVIIVAIFGIIIKFFTVIIVLCEYVLNRIRICKRCWYWEGFAAPRDMGQCELLGRCSNCYSCDNWTMEVPND